MKDDDIRVLSGQSDDDPQGALRAVRWDTLFNRLERINAEQAAVWRTTLLELISSADNDKFPDNDLVILSSDRANLYRAIVTRRRELYSGVTEIHIYLFEFMKPRNDGDDDTTYLMRAITIACRFRFLFLEEASDFGPTVMSAHLAPLLNGVQDDETFTQRDNTVRGIVARLMRELDLLKKDAVTTGLHDAALKVRYLGRGLQELQDRFSQIWLPLERDLRDSVAVILSSKQSSKEERKAAYGKFEKCLVECCRNAQTMNAKYLKGCMLRLGNRIDERVRSVAETGGSQEDRPSGVIGGTVQKGG